MPANKLDQNYEARAEVERTVGVKLREIAAILTEAKADPDLYRDGLTASLDRTLSFSSALGPQMAPNWPDVPAEPEA